MKKFMENVVENKTVEYQKTYSSAFRLNEMIKDIKVLGLPEDKMEQVIEIIKKYQK